MPVGEVTFLSPKMHTSLCALSLQVHVHASFSAPIPCFPSADAAMGPPDHKLKMYDRLWGQGTATADVPAIDSLRDQTEYPNSVLVSSVVLFVLVN